MEQANSSSVHHGRNIKRFREWMGIKQQALALELGDDWTQKKISLLEQKEIVDDALLQKVADALHVTPELLNTFDEPNPLTNITNFNDNSSSQGVISTGPNNTFNNAINPWDKWDAELKENKQLYERLLAAEREKAELYQKLVEQMSREK